MIFNNFKFGLFILSISLIISINSAFFLNPHHGQLGNFKEKSIYPNIIPLNMALYINEIKVSIQKDPSIYFLKLKEIIPENLLVRWYITRTEGHDAILEVVSEIPISSDSINS